MSATSLISVFLVGLLGGVHCVGMCGGIVTAFSLHGPGATPGAGLMVAYNLGRITTYVIAGSVAGALGAGGLLLEGILPMAQALYLLANLMLIALGVHLAGLWPALGWLERLGGTIWSRLQGWGATLLPARTATRAFATGLVWGWLPCGMVYSALFFALLSGTAATGALTMLAFGAGTLPNLLAMGYAAARLQRALQRRWVRLAAGLAVAAFGVAGLVRFALFPAVLGDFCSV